MAGTGGGDPEGCGAERFSGFPDATPPRSEARGVEKGLAEVRPQATDGRAGRARRTGRGGERVAAGRGAGPWAPRLSPGAGLSSRSRALAARPLQRPFPGAGWRRVRGRGEGLGRS